MYKIYVDGLLIHNQSSPDPSIHLISPVLKLQENAAGSLEFTIEKGHAGYGEINRFTSTIAVEKEGRVIWTGRVIRESEDFWKRRIFTCEGALAYLNDTYQPKATYSATNNQALFRSIINEHNKKVSENRQFLVGSLTIADLNNSYDYETDYEKTWDVIKNNFIDRYDGHLSVTYDTDTGYKPKLNYFANYPSLSSQTINFGKNLMDFTKNWDMTNICTVVIPKGQMIVEETGSTEGSTGSS